MPSSSTSSKGKGKAPEQQHNKSGSPQPSLAKLLNRNYIQGSTGRELALGIKSSISDTYLLLRIVRGEITDIKDPDLLTFDEEMQKQRDQISMYSSESARNENTSLINDAYQYFGLILNSSLSKENLFKFISLCIKKEFQNSSKNTAFRNSSFVKKYLQTQFGTTDDFPKMSEDAKRLAHVIFTEMKQNMPEAMQREPQKSFLNFIHFNFFTQTEQYLLALRAASQAGSSSPVVDTTTPLCQEVFEAIAAMQDPALTPPNSLEAASKGCCFSFPFFSKKSKVANTQDITNTGNPKLRQLEDFYKTFNSDIMTTRQQMLADQQKLLEHLSPDLKNATELMSKIVEPLITGKYQLLSQNLVSDQFVNALSAAYTQIKQNKTEAWYRVGPFSPQTSAETEEFLKKLKAGSDQQRKDCIYAYRNDPNNAHRDMTKLLDRKSVV